jgi:hypothetical protein
MIVTPCFMTNDAQGLWSDKLVLVNTGTSVTPSVDQCDTAADKVLQISKLFVFASFTRLEKIPDIQE